MRRGRVAIADGMVVVALIAVDLAVIRALVGRDRPADNDPIESWAALLPTANLAAVAGYDLVRSGSGRLRRLAWPLLVVGGILYAPFVLGPILAPVWRGPLLERLAWVVAAPGFLGGFLPGLVLLHRHLPHELPLAGLAATLLLAGLVWLGAPGRWRLLAAGCLATLATAATALIAYGLARA